MDRTGRIKTMVGGENLGFVFFCFVSEQRIWTLGAFHPRPAIGWLMLFLGSIWWLAKVEG
jgi:hypothetical protein